MTTVKRKLVSIFLIASMVLTCVVLVGCGGNSSSDNINVTSREDGSGTRGAFVELFGIEEKDETGEKVDKTTSDAAITNSTAVMMTTVAGDPAAIGYISLGSLDDSVKAVNIDGAAASVDAVKDGSYNVSRPFNVVTSGELSPAAADFMAFIASDDGQAIVLEEGYIDIESTGAYVPQNASGEVVVAGSSSVTPVMEKLAEAYQALNPNVTIKVNQSDSTTGIESTINGICDLGMASRDLKDSEAEQGLKATVIATDGIAVIVNKDNPVENLTSEQVKEIFTGVITTWSEIG